MKKRQMPSRVTTPEERLNLSLIRQARIRKVKMPQTMGTEVDAYEAMLNDLQIQISMLTSQATIEVQKAEILTNQIIEQINVAEASITEQLNQYSKELVAEVSAQVALSEQSVKFTDSNVYDMSFIRTMDYNKITILNEKTILEKRPDNREVFRARMLDMKKEATFHQGLINKTAENEPILYDLYNARNHFLIEYYLACISFYQEATIVGFLLNPTNNLENLKEYIKLNEQNIPPAKIALEGKRLSLGEDVYKEEAEKLKYIERMLVTAKYRLKYLEMAYAGKWTPPTFKTLTKIAEERDLSYSRVVYDLSEYTRQTLCVPDWILGMAEMYNQIEVHEQGVAIVPLNPFDPRWIRKAKEVMNLEASGVVNTSQKLFKCIDKYWESLTGMFQTIEDLHVDAIIEKARNEDTTPVTYYPYKDDGLDLVYFDEDLTVR